MPAVRTGPVIGLITQVVVLIVLTGAVGLGVAGWLAGIGYGALAITALALALHQAGTGVLSLADRVTLTRVTLVGAVAALTAESFVRHVPVDVLVGIVTVALLLDAVDGLVARRTATVTPLGARFDMEVDASLLVVLGVYVGRSVGWWVLVIGAMRYALGAATLLVPWLRGPVPPRYWRKVVAATQGVVLAVAAAGILPRPLIVAALVAAIGLLCESFGRDVGWLWRRRARSAQAGPVHAGSGQAGSVHAGSGQAGSAAPRSSAERRELPARSGQPRLG